MISLVILNTEIGENNQCVSNDNMDDSGTIQLVVLVATISVVVACLCCCAYFLKSYLKKRQPSRHGSRRSNYHTDSTLIFTNETSTGTNAQQNSETLEMISVRPSIHDSNNQSFDDIALRAPPSHVTVSSNVVEAPPPTYGEAMWASLSETLL